MIPKGYTIKTDNKMRDFGSTDTVKKTIRINKKIHKKAAYYDIPKKESSLANTIEHELEHARRPKASEKSVRNVAKQVNVKPNKYKKALYKLLT